MRFITLLCSLHVATSSDCALIEAINAWGAQVESGLRATQPPGVFTALSQRLERLRGFCGRSYPPVVQSLPVFYPFGGMDLLTAAGCFPHAPQYVLLADFPTGSAACFSEPVCAKLANESALSFFQHWANLRFSRQSTNAMRRAFARLGVLPGLVLSVRGHGRAWRMGIRGAQLGPRMHPPRDSITTTSTCHRGRLRRYV